MAKQFFKDLPDTTTPLTASRLNGLLDGEEALGNLVVDGIKSKNLCNLQENHFLVNANGTVINNDFCWDVIVDTRNINSLYISGDFSLLADSVLRIGGYSTYPILNTTGTRHSMSNNGSLNTTSYNYVLFSFLQTGSTTKDQVQNSFQIEKGNIGTTYMPFQELGTNNFKNEEIFIGNIKSKNMLDVRGIEQKTNNGVTCTYDSSTNIITLNGTVTSNTQANFNIPSAIGMKLKRLTKYTTSVFYISGTASGNLKFFAQDKNHNYDGIQVEFGGSNVNSTLQFDDNLIITSGYCLIRAYSGQVLDNLKFKIQIEENPTTTDYMPYQQLENKELYLTNETIIGTWFNGKPIYRKVIDWGSDVTINAGDWANVGYFPNVDTFINSYACKPGDATSQIRATTINNNFSIMNPSANFHIVVRYIIVEYTKTTD